MQCVHAARLSLRVPEGFSTYAGGDLSSWLFTIRRDVGRECGGWQGNLRCPAPGRVLYNCGINMGIT
jgi:hypothetical protein